MYVYNNNQESIKSFCINLSDTILLKSVSYEAPMSSRHEKELKREDPGCIYAARPPLTFI